MEDQNHENKWQATTIKTKKYSNGTILLNSFIIDHHNYLKMENSSFFFKSDKFYLLKNNEMNTSLGNKVRIHFEWKILVVSRFILIYQCVQCPSHTCNCI